MLKWLLPQALEQRLGAEHNVKSDFLLTLDYGASHLMAEAEFLGAIDSKLRAKRPRHRKQGKLMRGAPALPVQASVEAVRSIAFVDAASCRPLLHSCPTFRPTTSEPTPQYPLRQWSKD